MILSTNHRVCGLLMTTFEKRVKLHMWKARLNGSYSLGTDQSFQSWPLAWRCRRLNSFDPLVGRREVLATTMCRDPKVPEKSSHSKLNRDEDWTSMIDRSHHDWFEDGNLATDHIHQSCVFKLEVWTHLQPNGYSTFSPIRNWIVCRHRIWENGRGWRARWFVSGRETW